MTLHNSALFSGFSKLNLEERLSRLKAMGVLNDKDISYLKSGGLAESSLAEKLIENVIGYFQLPLGVASYFRLDGKDYCLPMAVEETSIVAAISKTAKWIRTNGHMQSRIIGDTLIGQLQIHRVKNFDFLEKTIKANEQALINKASAEVNLSLKRRGGGIRKIVLRRIEDMAVIHIHMDCCDAMGANIINQTLEFLKDPIETLTHEHIDVCILSNLNDSKLTEVTATIENIEPEAALRIENISRFAECCPYRAATHNKGVLNGIDPIVIATGNDWRAVEAAIHAYACRDGQYRAITTWRYEDHCLVGRFKAPVIVGTVGGVTQIHPTAKMCLAMLDVADASELSRVMAAAGLVQNLGALRALTTDGIIKGHMKLHIDNLIMGTNANHEESLYLKKKLVHRLNKRKHVSQTLCNDLLSNMREQNYNAVN